MVCSLAIGLQIPHGLDCKLTTTGKLASRIAPQHADRGMCLERERERQGGRERGRVSEGGREEECVSK